MVEYEYLPDGQLSQGDIIRGVGVISRKTGVEDEEIISTPSNVIVLSQNCEIDKFVKKRKHGNLLVAAVTQLSILDKNDQRLAREGRIFNYFYLPEGGTLPLECAIDWRTLQPVPLLPVADMRNHSSYVCTVTGDLHKAMAAHLFNFFFRPLEMSITMLAGSE